MCSKNNIYSQKTAYVFKKQHIYTQNNICVHKTTYIHKNNMYVQKTAYMFIMFEQISTCFKISKYYSIIYPKNSIYAYKKSSKILKYYSQISKITNYEKLLSYFENQK